MVCLFCGKEFSVSKQHGGQNRVFCFDCLPSGLSRKERNKRRHDLYCTKANNEKREIGCQNCGYNKYGEVLEWHHLDKNTKVNNPSELWKNQSIESWNEYQEEIKKCILLCANCHREWHVEHD